MKSIQYVRLIEPEKWLDFQAFKGLSYVELG